MTGRSKILMGLFLAVCILSVAAEAFLSERHAAFRWESWPGFYAAYGFTSCALLVLVSKYVLRPLVMRQNAEDSE